MDHYWTGGPPWVHEPAGGDAGRAAFLLPPAGSSFVARLDGARIADEQRLFEELNASLRFPVYFGWNWDAVSDCLRDLSWLPADHYLIVVEHSALLLRDSADDRATLLAVLERAGRHWSRCWERPGRSFNVLLL
jgi:RNAse (barnase) inhibitor barstar